MGSLWPTKKPQNVALGGNAVIWAPLNLGSKLQALNGPGAGSPCSCSCLISGFQMASLLVRTSESKGGSVYIRICVCIYIYMYIYICINVLVGL